jgi:hypothetical protein
MSSRPASAGSIRALPWIVAAGTLLSLLPFEGAFLLVGVAHAPVFVLLLFAAALARLSLARGRSVPASLVAKIYAACIAASLLMVLVHWTIRTDRSSTAAIGYFWTPLLVPLAAAFGILAIWGLFTVRDRRSTKGQRGPELELRSEPR